jgi:nitrite reductase/ring-hydroxylating ferredoxin subunit
VSFQGSRVQLDLSQTPLLDPVGSAVKIVDENRKLRLLIAHTARDRFVAIDEQCTHGGGRLTYVHQRQLIHCTCWGHAEFGLDGRVLFWPNSREGKPLGVYPVRVNGKMLAITIQRQA